MLCLVAMASIAFVSCEKDNTEDNTTQSNKDKIVGTWRVDNLTVNGENMTPENMLLIMNADGTGLFNDNGETENNEFTWSIEGNTLTIVHRHGSPVYTLSNFTDTECTLNGDTVPGFDQPMGTVVMHLVKVK